MIGRWVHKVLFAWIQILSVRKSREQNKCEGLFLSLILPAAWHAPHSQGARDQWSGVETATDAPNFSSWRAALNLRTQTAF